MLEGWHMVGKCLHLAAVLGMSMVAGAVSHAQTVPDGFIGVSAEVRHNDLDLTSAAGQAAFRKRVRAAVERMCTHPDPTESLAGTIKRECIALSQKSVDQQVEVAIAAAASAKQKALASRD